MSEKKSSTKKLRKKVWVDPDDAPELTKEWFEMADFYNGDKLIRRGKGRPPLESPKVSQTLRLDADILAAFKKTGAGWQTRMNDALRKAAAKL
ncbi:MAG: BrnA antitoxin family protein [Rickettsiales bacterium]